MTERTHIPRDVRTSRLRMVRRLVALILEGQTHRYMRPLSVLAKEHGCCERTIRRDLEVIEAQLPTRWRLNEGDQFPGPKPRRPCVE